ncbi:core-binding factor subunit beta isoform X3 [Paramuricea clavata]|uniref:Core-binding factor subunit beta isoform X3 n=1 Tax=Paramuricea clavata TaxID=317549 RepID=A0A7D9DKM4_PARCT|nr:core-binding factor subunit beta isoform X3 [Paramuricea clavata]
MPRVVEDQLGKFKTDPLFKQLQAQSEGFLRNGVNLLLSFPKSLESQYSSSEYVDFLREPGKVFLVAPLIFNGVCVKFYGWLDVQRLRGFGSLEFDEESAQIEDDFLRETLRRKHGSLEAASAAKAFEDMCCTSSEAGPRTSCIYDCRRIAQSRYSV